MPTLDAVLELQSKEVVTNMGRLWAWDTRKWCVRLCCKMQIWGGNLWRKDGIGVGGGGVLHGA